MKLERYISKWYRFSSLKEVGKTGIVALLLVVSTGIWSALFLQPSNEVIEKYKRSTPKSFLAIDALHVKNDDAFFHLFMNRLRKNNDVLVLGTSESGFMDSYNYWELLNADQEIDAQFSVIYGAGRSCERYIPHMLNNPQNWKKQRVLVILNPVYWRDGLSQFNSEYHNRYMNDQEVRLARKKSRRKEDYDLLFTPTRYVTARMNDINTSIDKHIHSLFYDRLRHFIGWQSEEINHLTLHPDYLSAAERTKPEILNEFKKEILPEHNCTQAFMDKGEYSMDPLVLDAKYRNTALDYFMELCKELEIDVTFVIGPYNNILASACGQDDVIKQHEKLEDQLRNKLDSSGFKYIDATEISMIPGSFIDKQHHSKYGGYLLYKTIKSNWNE